MLNKRIGRFSLVLLLGFSSFLTACAFNYIEGGLEELKGKPVKTAFNYLGFPDTKNSFEGSDVYVWGRSFQTTSFTPITSNSYGTAYGSYGNWASYQGTTTTYVPQVNTYSCVIKIAAEKGVIIQSSYEGSLGGCEAYGTALKPLYDERENREKAQQIAVQQKEKPPTKSKK